MLQLDTKGTMKFHSILKHLQTNKMDRSNVKRILMGYTGKVRLDMVCYVAFKTLPHKTLYHLIPFYCLSTQCIDFKG